MLERNETMTGMSNHDEEQDQPWTEEQWEKFLKTADLRAARYGELMETLIDDPDRDEIIDKEMGWEKEESDSEELLEAPQHDIAEAEDDEDEIPETELEEQDPGEMLPESVLAGRDDEEFFDSADRQLHRLPSYHLAEKLSKRIDELLVPHMKVRAEDGDDDVAQAFIQIKIASAKIAGGHQMGYHDEVLGGNVVNCKRALDAAQECRTALEGMLSREVFGAEQLEPLLADLSAVHSAIEKRIAELRARMWWEK